MSKLNNKYICQYCGKEFETGRQLGGHIVNCKLNPNSNKTRDKVSNTLKNKYKNFYHNYEIICPICGKKHIERLTENIYNKGKYKLCCSYECSHKLSVSNTNHLIKKEKQSLAIKKLKEAGYFLNKREKRYCAECGKEISFERLEQTHTKFCSEECKRKSQHRKLSENAKKNKTGGLKPETTHKYYKRGYYKGIWCDSSWELAYLLYNLDHNISIERNHKSIEYIFEGQKYNFYPDFIVNGQLVEIKGFYTPKNIAKREQIKNVLFIGRTYIKPYLKYAEKKYGKDYIKLYESA